MKSELQKRLFVTIKTLDGITVANRVACCYPTNSSGYEAGKEVVIGIAKDNNIPLRGIIFMMEYPSSFGDESTKTDFYKLKPKEILSSIFKEYLEYTPWTRDTKFGTRIDFYSWLRISYCSFRIVTGDEKSYIKITMNDCGYDSINDFTPDAEDLSNKYLKIAAPKILEKYNAKKFIDFIQKFNDEDKAKMLCEIAKFLGEEDLRTMLSLCKSYGMIHTVKGVTYPDGTHEEVLNKLDNLLNKIPVCLN